MTLRYILNYMISDFLLDQRERMARMDKLSLNTKDPDEIILLKEERLYLYNQGLQALRRHEHSIPECVKTYFLEGGSIPTQQEIMTELKDLHASVLNHPRKLGFWIVFCASVFLILVAIFL